MSKEPTIEELNNKLKEQLAVLEDKSISLKRAMEVYKDAAVTLEEFYNALEKARGEMIDIDERIESLRKEREGI